MKRFYFPVWFLLFAPALVVAQPLLWPTDSSLIPSVSDQSELAYQYEIERFYNDKEGYGEHQTLSFVAQHCFLDNLESEMSACLGGEKYSDWSRLQQASGSTTLKGRQQREYSQFYLSGHWEADDDVTLEGLLGRLDSGYVNGFVKLKTDTFSVWLGQDARASDLNARLEFQLTDDEQHYVSTSNTSYLGSYMGASIEWLNHDVSYQQLALNQRAIKGEQWQIRPHQSGVEFSAYRYSENLETPLYFDGMAVSQYDNWQSEYERAHHYIGWRWEKSWLGLYRDQIHFDADAYLRLSDKSWNSNEIDSLVEGAVLSTIYAMTGNATADSEFLALRVGRNWQWSNFTLSWDNLIGDMQVSSASERELRIILLENQVSAGRDEFHDTLWVPNVALGYRSNNWRFIYTFQQIIPFSELRELITPSNDSRSSSSSNSGNATASETNDNVSKDWLWPQVGGYHQLTFAYLW